MHPTVDPFDNNSLLHKKSLKYLEELLIWMAIFSTSGHIVLTLPTIFVLFYFFQKDFVEENPQLSTPSASPSTSPVNKRVEDLESIVDRVERPSPISVLEPLFTEDDISPAGIKLKPGWFSIKSSIEIFIY